jgi:hypothetical protein
MVDIGLNMIRGRQALVLALVTLAPAACVGDRSPVLGSGGEVLCDVNQNLLFSSLPPDAIWAITNPIMVEPDAPGADYLVDSDRVLGVYLDGQARAYPHPLMRRHEIVNDEIDGTWVSVTFCPLTGSGLAFDPHIGDDRLQLAVSGLLFANNLVMFDRGSQQVYGPQLDVVARCDAFTGEQLALMPLQEMSWGRWKELHPGTLVVSRENDPFTDYRFNPYAGYDRLDSDELVFPMSVDESRPIKERVLTIRVGEDGGRGYPFGELAELGNVVALNETVGGVPTAVFYEARDGQTALAFDARVDGETLTFDVDENGSWKDQETGSTWRIDGQAIAGPLRGERLETRADSYTAYWFAWRHFQPNGSTFLN